MKKILILACLPFVACTSGVEVEQWISTTPENQWVDKKYEKTSSSSQYEAVVDTSAVRQTIDGFGACFNELGWTSLNYLSESDRESIFKEMFAPGVGAAFTFCRMPVGANDFSRNWYSYCEKDGDFNMESFSIANDLETLIPFIKNAQKYNPDLRIWASPWSPPTWMKYNKHYACRPSSEWNDLPGDPALDREGENMFIQDDLYFAAYAEYFAKFIEAYRNEGINIFAVAPQNEFNSCQIFPSCTWQSSGLNRFIGGFLGPKMKDMGVDIVLGTMERGTVPLVDTIMNDPVSNQFIKWIGFQWAGKNAIETVHGQYPNMKLMQTESECGDGANSWEYCFYTWNLMKHYFNNGVSAYEYWNISLQSDALSRWGWRQNSLVSVDKDKQTYKYNPEYYLMKHFSKYVRPEAKMLTVTGDYEDMLAFRNTDGSVILVMANNSDEVRKVNVTIGKTVIEPELQANSINTIVLK